MEDKKVMINGTPYEWCLNGNMRILDAFKDEDEEDWYYTTNVEKEDFMEWLSNRMVKPNSTPRKTPMYLEYRMYGIVPYNISPIQAGIQFGHGVVRYNIEMREMGGLEEEIYYKWAGRDETFIILNGGTTNERENDRWYGSMQKMRDALKEAGIVISEFFEPDLNYALTSVNFLVDERVFNRELYPDYVNMPYPWADKPRGYKPKDEEVDKWESENNKNYEKWVEKIGGPKNAFLRDFLKPLRLANN
jgi:hypothetical protein